MQKKTISVIISIILLLTLMLSLVPLMTSCKPKTEVEEYPFDDPDDTDTEKKNDDDAPKIKSSVKRKDGMYNFLVIGRDERGSNTDVIMVVSYDTKNKKVSTLQIPRDSYVLCDGAGRKINSVYYHGYSAASRELYSLKSKAQGADKAKLTSLCEDSSLGIDYGMLKDYVDGKISHADACKIFGIKALQSVIKDTFGVITDYYICMGLDGFRAIVDTIGGVDVHVQEDMIYSDPYQDLYINIKKGDQHLDGDDAEGFVRFRYGYAGADIARIDAQKIFMTAFAKKLFSVSTVGKIPDLVKTIMKYVTTDLSLSDATYFGVNAITLDLSSITMFSMQGKATYYNGASIYSMNQKANLDIVNGHFNVFDADIPAESLKGIAITDSDPNASTIGATAQNIDDTPPDLGFLRRSGSSSRSDTQTQTQTQTVNPADDAKDGEKTEEKTEGKETPENVENTQEDEKGEEGVKTEKEDSEKEENKQEEKIFEGSEKAEEKSGIGNKGPVELPEIDINSLSE